MLRRATQARADGQAGAARDDVTHPPDRWSALLAAQAVPIYRWIYARVGNREQAEVLTTRVFDTAARELRGQSGRMPDAPSSDAAAAWLLQIARAVVADDLRAFYGAAAGAALERLQRALEEDGKRMSDDETDDLVRANRPAARAHNLLARLPARERDVLTCRFLLGYPIDRAAAQLHLSVAETMALQFVALKHAAELESAAPAGDDQGEEGHMHEGVPAPAAVPAAAPASEEAPRVLQDCCCR